MMQSRDFLFRLKINDINVFVCLFLTTGCFVILLLFVGFTCVLHEIKLCTDIYSDGELRQHINSNFAIDQAQISRVETNCFTTPTPLT